MPFIQPENPLANEAKSWIAKDIKNMDADIYPELQKRGETMASFLEDLKSQREGKQSPYWGMTDLEKHNYQKMLIESGQPVPETALESLLRIANIRVSGSMSDTVGKTFSYSGTDVLFPAVVSQVVGSTLLRDSIVPQFVYREEVVPGLKYDKLQLLDTAYDRQLAEVGPMSDLPETNIATGERHIKLRKYGRYLRMAYEEMMGMGMAALNDFLRRMAMQIQVDMSNLLAYRFINGDGNSNTTPGTTVESTVSGTIAFNDIINFSNGAPSPYKIDKFLGRKALLNDWYSRLYDGSTTSIGNNTFGLFPTPVEWDESTITSDVFIGVDTRRAALMLTGGGVQTNAGELIRQTAKEIAVHTYYEIAIADSQAVVLFDETH